MSEIAKALPGDRIQITTDPWTERFWVEAKEGRLTCCQCASCGTFRMPPSPFCPKCQSQEARWPELPGTGTVFSYIVVRRSPYPDVPDFTYIPVTVDLDGAPGARFVTNLIGLRPEDVQIGMKVKALFNDIQDGWKWPVFQPA